MGTRGGRPPTLPPPARGALTLKLPDSRQRRGWGGLSRERAPGPRGATWHGAEAAAQRNLSEVPRGEKCNGALCGL